MEGIIEEKNRKNKVLSIENAKAYRPEKAKTEKFIREIQTNSGIKVKEMESTTYENGVVKNRLVGLTKDGKRIF